MLGEGGGFCRPQKNTADRALSLMKIDRRTTHSLRYPVCAFHDVRKYSFVAHGTDVGLSVHFVSSLGDGGVYMELLNHCEEGAS